MQLHIIKIIIIDASNNVLRHIINKDAYTLWLILSSYDWLSF